MVASPLAEAHVAAQVALRDAIASSAERVWNALPNHDEESIPLFLNTMLPTLEAGQRHAVALVDGYMANALERSAYGLNPRKLIGDAVRNGVTPNEVYRRPFVALWSELKGGKLWMTANQIAIQRLRTTIRTDLVRTQNLAGAAVVYRDPKVFGLRRVLNGTCDLCVEATNVEGYVLQPIHPGCECGIEPVMTKPRPAAQAVPEVHQHGELGPVFVENAPTPSVVAPSSEAEQVAISEVANVAGLDEQLVGRIMELRAGGMSFRKIRDELQVEFSHAKVRSIYELVKKSGGDVGRGAVRGAERAAKGVTDEAEARRIEQLVQEANAAARSAQAALERAQAARRVAERVGQEARGEVRGVDVGVAVSKQRTLTHASEQVADNGIERIRAIHNMPENAAEPLNRVRVTDVQRRGSGAVPGGGKAAGWYSSRETQIMFEKYVSDGVADQGARELVFLHEFGHYLDNLISRTMIARGYGGFSSEFLSSVTRPIIEAIEKTAQQRLIYARYDSNDYAEYLGSEREEFARAYAQYIVEKTNDIAQGMEVQTAQDIVRRTQLQRLVGEMNRSMARRGPTQQWTHSEFQPIKEAFDTFFQQQGLLK
jgi:hypothetical protein